MEHIDVPTTPSNLGVRTSRTPRRVGVALGAMALAALPLLAACGEDDADASSIPEGPIEVTAIDYAYEGLPETVRAGASIELTNASDDEVHELVAVRLPDDEERPVAELVQLPPEELAAFFPGVAAVIIAPPGETGIAVEGTGALTEPGRYAILCVIPTGADPGEYLAAAAEAEGGPPDVAGGPPHIAQGMYGEVTVVE